jgi:hypothetical protein
VETGSTAPAQDKQITVAVPEDRVADFYAFFGRFLEGRRGPGGRRGGRRGGPHGHHHHGCRGHHGPDEAHATTEV